MEEKDKKGRTRKEILGKWNKRVLMEVLKSKSDFNRYIGHRLQNFRIIVDCPMKDIAKRLNTTIEDIQKYEEGQKTLSFYEILIYLDEIKVSVRDFFGEIADLNSKFVLDDSVLETIAIIRQFNNTDSLDRALGIFFTMSKMGKKCYREELKLEKAKSKNTKKGE